MVSRSFDLRGLEAGGMTIRDAAVAAVFAMRGVIDAARQPFERLTMYG